MTKDTHTIELTAAEKAYIEAQRATAEALIIEKREKAALLLQQEISAQKKRIATEQGKYDAQNAAARHYFLEFPSKWKLVETKESKTFNVTGDYITPENPSGCNYDRVIPWTETVEFTKLSIVKPGFTVNVIFDPSNPFKTSTSYMSIGSSYNGHNKYTRVKGVLKRIKETEAVAAEKIATQAKSVAAKQTMEEKIASLYPTAKATFDNEYVSASGYGRRRNSQGYYKKVFTLLFPNGFNVKCQYYDDCSVTLIAQGFQMDIKDTFERIDILSSVKIPKAIR